MSLTKGPYENHYYALGEPIRNIVKQGQELLCAIEYGSERQKHSDFWDKYWASREARYPQSLGELCIAIAEEKLLAYKVHGKMTDLIKEHIERVGVFGIKITKWFPRNELDTLREHLYHKRTQ